MCPIRTLFSAAILCWLLAGTARAQITFPEIEPNGTRAEATVVNGVVSGDTITGSSSGTSTTAGSTAVSSADMFRVRTAALPPGIYKHGLTITTTTTAVPNATIRGLNVNNGVVTSSDVSFQAASTTTSPPRTVFWYGFGRQEELYVRVAGTSSTSAPYTLALGTSAVTPTIVPTALQSGLLTLSTAGVTTVDTEMYVFDAALQPLAGFHNENTPAGDQAVLARGFAPGTYYVAVSDSNLAMNVAEVNPDEARPNNPVLDFPDVLAASDSETAGVGYDITISDGYTTVPVTLVGNGDFDVAWARFDVVAGSPAVNDDCSAPIAISLTADWAGAVNGYLPSATHDGTASCDASGPAGRDLWYSVTAPAVGGTLHVETCGFGAQTVVTAFAGCAGPELGCNDDCSSGSCTGGPGSCLDVAVAGNQVILLRVSDRGAGGGLFRLSLSFVGTPPRNDDCSSPLILLGPGTYPFDTSWSTSSSQSLIITPPCTNRMHRDIWFLYTATKNGLVRVSTCGGVLVNPTNTLISIYGGAGCPTGPGLTCDDDAGGAAGSPECAVDGFAATASRIVACGDVLLIQLGNSASGYQISGTFTLTEIGLPCGTPLGPIKNVPSEWPTIQSALDACVNGDTVLVAPGTYVENIVFNGRDVTVKSSGGPSVTTIDANHNGPGVLFRWKETRLAVLEGFTITNGSGVFLSPSFYGAGITAMLSLTTPTIRGNIVTGNGGVVHGGGIMSYQNANPLIENNVIFGNSCTSSGGGIYFSGGSGEVRGNVIYGNTAGGSGGGINAAFGGTQLIINNLITANQASSNGGGIFAGNANTTLENNTIVGNTAGSSGGGIHGSTGAIRNCIVWGNTAGTNPAINPLTLANVTYSDVEGGYAGTGNFGSDPLFVAGPLGNHYLSDATAGQAATSPCVDAGNPTSTLLAGTTRTDGVADTGVIDLGYHALQQSPISAYCFGDGSGTPCPCANSGATGNGCASSAFVGGARLVAGGLAGASSATDSLVLTATNIPGPGLFFQGNVQVAGGVGVAFGDGLLCIGGSIVRLGVVFSTGGTASYPGGSTPNPIHLAGGTVSGDIRNYQCWYRDATFGFCSADTFNLTQAVSLTWGP